MLLERVLEAPGREVVAYSNAREALKDMRRSPPDVVLTDLHMPGLSGVEFIEKIREEFGLFSERSLESQRSGTKAGRESANWKVCRRSFPKWSDNLLT